MNTLILITALFLQDASAPPTKEDATEALREFREAFNGGGENVRVDAAKDALGTPHTDVIKTVGKLLTKDTERVRIGVALALGEVDHPNSVQALNTGLRANLTTSSVLAAIVTSQGKLGWESSAASLHILLKDVGKEDIRAVVPDAIKALSAIGSASSIDPLLDLLSKLQNNRKRNPWKGTKNMKNDAIAALKAITGGKEKNHMKWRAWWKENQKSLLSGATKTYWSWETHQREDTGIRDKAPKESVLVGLRLVAKKENKKEKK